MSTPGAAWNHSPGRGDGSWRRFSASLPMRTALLAVGSVWILGCVWSYQEQSAFAASKGFTFPHLLPLVIDGFAVSMAGVAWAASLDARPAIPARLATVVAVGASSASNGVWAYLRAHHDMVTVVLGIAVPVAANLAFEVLLAELRRQVQRRRGLPPPVAVPYPRLIRIALAPWQTFRTWRTLVLEITAVEHGLAAAPAEPPIAAPALTPPNGDAAALASAHPVLTPLPASTYASPEDAGTAHALDRGVADPRVVRLAQYLLATEVPDEITGEMVGTLLNIEAAPRTGRRLLGQARALVDGEQLGESDGRTTESSLTGRR